MGWTISTLFLWRVCLLLCTLLISISTYTKPKWRFFELTMPFFGFGLNVVDLISLSALYITRNIVPSFEA